MRRVIGWAIFATVVLVLVSVVPCAAERSRIIVGGNIWLWPSPWWW